MSSPMPLPVLDPPIALSPAIDRGLCAAIFRQLGRVHIPGALTDDAAQRLYRSLAKETPWSLCFNNGGESFDLENQTPDERRQHAMGAWERARSQFQYIYENHRLTHMGEPYVDPKHYLAKLVTFLNMPEFLTFVHHVTGMRNIMFADAQATLYKPGDFLTIHDDRDDPKKRLAAYVLNFTPQWRADWGGILQFTDAGGHIIEGFTPSFNALNLFRVPQLHMVSQVSLFGAYRYSVTGWLRSR